MRLMTSAVTQDFFRRLWSTLTVAKSSAHTRWTGNAGWIWLKPLQPPRQKYCWRNILFISDQSTLQENKLTGPAALFAASGERIEFEYQDGVVHGPAKIRVFNIWEKKRHMDRRIATDAQLFLEDVFRPISGRRWHWRVQLHKWGDLPPPLALP